jgi:hypothetical protein
MAVCVKRNSNAMKHFLPPDPNAGLELEIHAARIITDTMPDVPVERRAAYTSIVGSLSTLERQLADLEVPQGGRFGRLSNLKKSRC